MSTMDICVPAFAENGYYEDQASSTFAMAVECNVCSRLTSALSSSFNSLLPQVPILVTKRTRQAYVYADDDRAVVTRPAAMREILAVKALRTRSPEFFLESPMPNMPTKLGGNKLLREAVEAMMHRGWTRTKAELEDFKTGLWKRNDALAEKLLRDI